MKKNKIVKILGIGIMTILCLSVIIPACSASNVLDTPLTPPAGPDKIDSPTRISDNDHDNEPDEGESSENETEDPDGNETENPDGNETEDPDGNETEDDSDDHQFGQNDDNGNGIPDDDEIDQRILEEYNEGKFMDPNSRGAPGLMIYRLFRRWIWG